MANNPYVNKVELADGRTLIDLTNDTVTSGSMLSGTTAHDASGASVTGSIANGTITNNTSGGTSSGTINRGSQIKIGSGYYGNDLYYTAQANVGTKNISSSGTISVDGYLNALVPNGQLSFGSEYGQIYDYCDDGTSTDFSFSIQPDVTINAGWFNAQTIEDSVSYFKIKTANPAFDGGALSGIATASGSSCSISDITNNSGVSIITACTATRGDVLYNGPVAGWVTKEDNAQALAGDSVTMTPTTYYLNGVTITTPSSGTRQFTITVPNGNTTANFVFNIDSSGNVTITES